jgi:uncharacterized integral membrane protein
LKYEVHEADYGNFSATRGTLIKTIYVLGTTSVEVPFDQETSHYKVRVYNTYWLYSDSDELTADPTRVELLDIFVAGEKDLRVQWTENPDTDFKSYTLYMSTIPGFSPSETDKVTTITDKAATTYTVTKLKSNKPYYFVVKVQNEVGLEVVSNHIEAKTLKKDRSPELYNLAMTGIYLAIVAFIILILCILILLVQATTINKLKREGVPKPHEHKVLHATPPPQPNIVVNQAPPPPGPPSRNVPVVEAYRPQQRRP